MFFLKKRKRRNKKMTINYGTNKSKIITITLSLLLTLSAISVLFSGVNAQTSTKTTYAYIGATPNPVGVNGQALLHVGIPDPIGTAADGWEGLTITVTDPQGNEEILGPLRTDSTGGTGTVYTPTMVGTYTLVTNFPEQEYDGVLFKASSSEPLDLIVTEEQVEYYPGHSLPTEYWGRPIDGQLREWSAIAGDWMTTPDNKFAPNNDGPESAHILWAKPLTMGGLVGGAVGNVGYENGDAYEGFFANSVIIAGRLYYNRYKSNGGSAIEQEVVCVDIHTGEEIWSKILGNNERLAFGQNFYWNSYNYQGTFPFLWTTVGSTWNAYDAFTGRWVYNMTDVPSGSNLYDSNGAIYRYQVNLKDGWMMLWNTSRVVSDEGSFGRAYLGQTFNVSADDYTTRPRNSGYEWNVSIPLGLPGSVKATFLEDRIIGADLTNTEVTIWGISVKPGEEGTLLFNNTWSAPADWTTGNISFWGMMNRGWVAASAEDKVAVLNTKETRQLYGVSLETGDLIWGPTPSMYYLNMWDDQLSARVIAYGKLYVGGVSGIVYCYDVNTGDLLWTYEAEDPYTEYLFSNNWWIGTQFITDGKIYVGHGEHSGNQPLPRGAPFICLNATTGDVIWRTDGLFRQTDWGGFAMISDSTIIAMDTYDQRIYAIGKGPSATTVTAPDVGVSLGNSVMIRGTVTDISPGTKDSILTMRFPNGIPVVADEDMGNWMLYVYKQFELPDVTGVEVKLEVLDPNGNFYEIGTVTSDASGMFKLFWEPEVPGEYTIIATFKGTESYWGSYAETAIGVTEAASPAIPIEPEQTPDTQQPDTETPDTEQLDTQTPDTETPDTETPTAEAPLISTELAIIAAVAVACVIGVAAYLALRKRK
ncbi:MAG: hypothetical protein CW691_04160 [Candidatus Bathyarchaeum sp.]|nr:MAG: hypothetical protein CW691_04160 [Candidatus Bathyarchaeum sp.]